MQKTKYIYGFFAIDGIQHYGIIDSIKPSKEREVLDYLDDITTKKENNKCRKNTKMEVLK